MGNNEEKITTEVVVVNLEELPRKWGWLQALGILMLVTGSIGLLQSVTMTLVTVLFFGAIIMVNGTFALVQTIIDRGKNGVARWFMSCWRFCILPLDGG